MEKILLFDTSIGTDNVGDNIIMDYCTQHLTNLFQNVWYDRIPTHLELGKTSYQLNREALFSFVCGTNILKTSIIRNRGWKIGMRDALNLKNIVLMGVGWGNYNTYQSDPYTKWVYKSIFSKTIHHSVRDSYTKKRLNEIGIKNVINTSCPTTWNLTQEHCSCIPRKKSKIVIAALTYYKPDIERDRYMMNILNQNYDKIYLWIQQAKDYEYFKSLNTNFQVEIINPLLSEYDFFLVNNEVDFVGSRLHGGIRSLNHKKRTLIIGIDNRAKEINRDINIPFLDRNEIEKLDVWINGHTDTNIVLPTENINNWKSQFFNI